MGSLNPFKVPKPEPILVSPPNPEPPVGPVEKEPTQKELDQDSSVTRAQNILKRRRGRAGTIKTSFRGVLTPNNLSPRRKTLLGE